MGNLVIAELGNWGIGELGSSSRPQLNYPITRLPNYPIFSVLHASHQRPYSRDVDLLDRHGAQVGLCEERRQIEIRFEADMHGEGREAPFDPRERRIRAAEVIEDDDAAA